MQHIITAYQRASKRLFLLDYDGTLADIAPTPPEAVPTSRMIDVLSRLAGDERNTVVILSGRDGETLDKWLGALPLEFAAEHGAVVRRRGEGWQLLAPAHQPWRPEALQIMQHAVASTPGSLIEEKRTSLVWHYRTAADPKAAESQAGVLEAALQSLAQANDLIVLRGHKVIEIKIAVINKGSAARQWIDTGAYDFIFGAGDDTTDEDMFRVLPPTAFSLKIGAGATHAREHLDTPSQLLDMLSQLTSA